MRREEDYLGEVELPSEAYYGVHTFRALNNFPTTYERFDKKFIWAYFMVKKAVSYTHLTLPTKA